MKKVLLIGGERSRTINLSDRFLFDSSSCFKIGCMMYKGVCDVQGGTRYIRMIRNFTNIKQKQRTDYQRPQTRIQPRTHN